MKLVNKTRRGVGLIMALVVLLVVSTIIALTFEIVFNYSWFSQQDNVGFVIHSTMLDVMEAEKALIVGTNHDAGQVVLHGRSEVLKESQRTWSPPPPFELLKVDDLRLADYPKTITIGGGISGAGRQTIEVDVFDMFFGPAWVDYDVLRLNAAEMEAFPPVYNMEPEGGASGMEAIDEKDIAGIDKDVISDKISGLSPENYGAYLVRIRLLDRNGKLLRTTEAAFVQIIPDS